MKFNFTKFTLPALLIAASASAFAQGDASAALVQVGNSSTGISTMSWDDFAKNVNSPTIPVAFIDPTEQVAQDKENAKSAYFEAVDFLNAKDALLNTAKLTLQDSQSEYNTARDNLNATSSDKVTAPWLQTILNAALSFQDDYNMPEFDDGAQIFYKRESGRGVVVSIAFNLSDSEKADGGWSVGNQQDFYDYITGNPDKNEHVTITPVTTINTLRIYLGSDYKEIAQQSNPQATEYYTVNSFVYNDITIANQIVGALETLANMSAYQVFADGETRKQYQALIASYNTPDEKLYGKNSNGNARTRMQYLESEVTRLTTEKGNWETKVGELKTAYDNAQKAYDDALAAKQNEAGENYRAAYQYITLLGDVEATTAIAQSFLGTIYGGGHTINVNITNGDQKTLFASFGGHLTNAAVNGPFAATTARGFFDKVAYVNSADNTYRYYNENGAMPVENISSIGELGFVARKHFGVDLIKGTVAAVTNANKVYQINVYNRIAEGNTLQVYNHSYYVNKTSNNFVTEEKPNGVLEANSFFTSATDDLNNVANCIHYNTITDTDTEGNTITRTEAVCNSVEITDKDVFFCPMPLTAANVTYVRELAKGFNSVCLPFDLNKSEITDVTYLCTYKSLSADGSKFIFTETDVLPANTPGIVYTENAVDLSNLFTNKALSMTGSQIKVLESEAGGKSYGTFRKVAYNDPTFKGEAIYGLAPKDKTDLSKGYNFAKATGGNFPSFRMMIATPQEEATVTTRSISIVNSIGEDITASVLGITNDTDNANSLKVIGGQGEIILSADTNIDNVTVYSIDGREAAVVNVEAGIATSVNVSNGLYIVNGQKVLVK